MNIIQEEIDYRLGKLYKYISDKGESIAEGAFIGKECTEMKLQQLQLVIGLTKLLEKYLPLQDEVLASLTFQISPGYTLTDLTVNGISIISAAGIVGGKTGAQIAADAITRALSKTSSPEYTITSNNDYLTITALPGTGVFPNNYIVSYTGGNPGDGSDFTLDPGILSRGENKIIASDNCITETQIQKVSDKLSSLTNLCFPAIGTL